MPIHCEYLTRIIMNSATRGSQPSARLLSSILRTNLQTTLNRPSTAASLPSLSSQTPYPRLLPNTAISSLSFRSSLLGQSPFRSFSASAPLGVKRDTYNPSRRVQKRRHGFLARLRTRGGRKILQRRRKKGRKNMSW